jgi:hypothetical protein
MLGHRAAVGTNRTIRPAQDFKVLAGLVGVLKVALIECRIHQEFSLLGSILDDWNGFVKYIYCMGIQPPAAAVAVIM